MKKMITRLTAVFLLLSLMICGVGAVPAGYDFPDDWSREALIFAVENEILFGDKHQDLRPKHSITRAEMAAVLVRLLGAEEQADLSAFTDVKPTAWYYKELSAAVAAGIFSGVTSTQMQPDAPITREQAVTVISRAFSIVSTEQTANFSDWNSVSSYARDSVSAMTALGYVSGYSNGTFQPKKSITRAEVAQLIYQIFDCIADTPDEIPAGGTVLYRGSEALPAELTHNGDLILGLGLETLPEMEQWSVSGTLTLRTVKGGTLDLAKTDAARLVCAVDGMTLLNGSEAEVWLCGTDSSYQGDADALYAKGSSHAADGSFTTVGLRSGTLTLSGTANTVAVSGDTALELNGAADTVQILGKDASVSGSGHAVTLEISVKTPDVDITYDTLIDYYKAEHDTALSVVKTMQVPCKVLVNTALYQNQNLTGKICDVPAGSTVYNEWFPDDYAIVVSLPNGTKGWIQRWACEIDTENEFTDGDYDYSDAIKEGFVDLKGYDSKTEYLIWVSKYTQKVIVFQGSKGNWNVIHTFPCSTGKNLTPTPSGVYEVYYHNDYWYADEYFMYTATGFSGGHAFHSVLMNYGGGYYDGRVGIPLSHGCVRMYPEAARYIYELPNSTRVVVF